MKKILASFGFENHAKMLVTSSPSFIFYANRFNYDVFFPCESFFSDSIKSKPFSWWKIELITNLLHDYDRVLWLDADVIICKFDQDINNELDNNDHFGLVVHQLIEGLVPNCGVWIVDKKSLSWLDQLWKYDNLSRSHDWWEQNALMEFIGIDSSNTPITIPKESKIPWKSLNYYWNNNIMDKRHICSDFKFFHSSKCDDRHKTMQTLANNIIYN